MVRTRNGINEQAVARGVGHDVDRTPAQPISGGLDFEHLVYGAFDPELAAAIAQARQREKPQITWDEILDMRRLETYEDEAAFTLPLRVSRNARAGTQKLLVNASYQACNEKMCLPPRTVTLELPVEVKR